MSDVLLAESLFMRTLSVFIVNFEHISHLVLVFLFLTFNMLLPVGQSKIYDSFFPEIVNGEKSPP